MKPQRPGICVGGVDRIAELQTVEAAAVLRSGIKVRGGQGEARNAEGIRRVGFLRRDHAAARPLVAAAGSAECDSADISVAIDYGCPHVESQTAVLLFLDRRQGGLQIGVTWHLAAVRSCGRRRCGGLGE